MGKTSYSKKAIFCTVIILALFSFVNRLVPAENKAGSFREVLPNDVPDILNMLSILAHNNYERIKTWQGTIDITVDRTCQNEAAERIFRDNTHGVGEVPKTVRRRRESSVEFAADCGKNLYYANKYHRKPVRYIEPETGRDLGNRLLPSHEIVIGTPQYKIFSQTERRMAIKHPVSEGAEGCASCGEASVYDPRESLLPGRPVWETFSLLLQYLDQHGELSVAGHSVKVEERIDGSNAEYRIEIPAQVAPQEFVFVTMVFSSGAGFNITSMDTTRSDGQLFQKMSWDYVLLDGVYLPNKITQQDYSGEEARLTCEKVRTFKNMLVNRDIPERTFTYKNLALQNGDRFIDEGSEREYTYQDDVLVEVQENRK